MKRIIIGLLGGIAAGKSSISYLFEGMGFSIINADEIVHKQLTNPEIVQLVSKNWPEVIMDSRIDRKKLGHIVFNNDDEMKKLDSIIHPVVKSEILKCMAEIDGNIILDVPLLLESGLDRLCDYLIYISVDEAERERRCIEDRGWEPGERAKRESKQVDDLYKRSAADFDINNNGDLAYSKQQIVQILTEIQ